MTTSSLPKILTPGRSSKLIISFGLALFAWWLLGAALLPLVQDEAYYNMWAHHLDLGYFDHPPLVAVIAATTHLSRQAFWATRFGNVIIATLTVAASIKLFGRLGLTSRQALVTAVLLTFVNVLGLIYGFITTPDTGLLLAWTLALHEAAAALQGQRCRWLSAGAATGLGLLSKYTMLLIGPVFLWGLWCCDRRALRTAWPYLGGVVALLVFSPNLFWNAQNDWITFKFQLRHGLALERPVIGAADVLPRPLLADPASPEAQLGALFAALDETQLADERWYDATLAALNRYIGFYASQLALWGAFLPLIFAESRRRWRQRKNLASSSQPKKVIPHSLMPLVMAGWIVPLFVFGLLSLKSKVEANWTSMYIVSAAAYLTPYLQAHQRKLRRAAWINLGLVALVLLHARFSLLPLRPRSDRILKETHGYNLLAEHVKNLEGPIFADSYQITALLNFYSQPGRIEQWPGITRDSELIRRREFIRTSYSDLTQAGFFWLVTTDRPPPRLLGFAAVQLSQLRDCKWEGLQEISSTVAIQVENRCKKPVHEWYLVRYQLSPPKE